MIAISNCAAKNEAWHPFFQGPDLCTFIVCTSTWHRWAELLLFSLRWWKPITWPCLVPSCNYCLPLSFQIHLCTLPLGPCFHLHPVQSRCEVKTLRHHEQEHQKNMSRFSLWITSFKYYHSRNILKLISLLASQLNEEQFVLARTEKSGGNASSPVVFPFH